MTKGKVSAGGRRLTGEAVTPLPAMRYMTVIAQDPSVRVRGKRRAILTARIAIPAEDLIPGPTGYRVQVVDYDASTRRFNGPHTLPDAYEAEPSEWRSGALRIVEDPRFRAQNVYALVMKTLARFEFALGRRVGWSFKTHQLKVAPQGMLDANAFYSPQEEGLVFGYFPGRKGNTVYSCLSHDVVVHETTHALIDALRERYLDPSSPDQAALHEGMSDVIALLSVFSQPEILGELLLPADAKPESQSVIARSDLSAEALRESTLFGLAEEMGSEIQGARGEALRHSARLRPNPRLLDQPEFEEPHRRGEVLVAAVMNGFIDAWAERLRGLGVPGRTEIPLQRVAEEGADVAEALATMWIRGLDYMPPVHVEFPDALSGALTADFEVRPDDSRFELRRHMLESFDLYGIRPASSTIDPVGTWNRPPGGLRYDRVRFESMRTDKDEVFRFLWENRTALRLREGAYCKVLSVRSCVRVGIDGFVLRETVAEYYQVARLTANELQAKRISAPADYIKSLRDEELVRKGPKEPQATAKDGDSSTGMAAASTEDEADEEGATTPLYGGGTLIFDEYGRLKYHIHNDVFGRKRQSKRLKHLWETGQLEPGRESARLRVSRLSTIHRLRAIDARRFPGRRW